MVALLPLSGTEMLFFGVLAHGLFIQISSRLVGWSVGLCSVTFNE